MIFSIKQVSGGDWRPTGGATRLGVWTHARQPCTPLEVEGGRAWWCALARAMRVVILPSTIRARRSHQREGQDEPVAHRGRGGGAPHRKVLMLERVLCGDAARRLVHQHSLHKSHIVTRPPRGECTATPEGSSFRAFVSGCFSCAGGLAASWMLLRWEVPSL